MTIQTTLIIISLLFGVGGLFSEPVCHESDRRVEDSGHTWNDIKNGLDPDCGYIAPK